MNKTYSLRQLGWQPFYQQQLSLEDYEHHHFGRVVEHHRDYYVVQLESARISLPVINKLPPMTVGDWLLLDKENRFNRLFERQSLFSRKGAGVQSKQQFIAANIDTLFIVMSLNQDFNLNRLERYLVLAKEASVEPVVILSKADLCDDIEYKVQQVIKLDALLTVIPLNGLSEASVELLSPWCNDGKTVSFVGSSGVGKSTLINRVLGQELIATNTIRIDNDKGKHTTTARSVYITEGKGIIIDTPGIREVQILGEETSLHNTFNDIEQLAQQCRFGDCHHIDEPGCAVKAAIVNGELAQRRLDNFHKLRNEQLRNNASLKQNRDKDRKFGKMVRHALKVKNELKS